MFTSQLFGQLEYGNFCQNGSESVDFSDLMSKRMAMHVGPVVYKHGSNFEIATMATKMTMQWSKSNQSRAIPNYT